jgi:hypothetical protein
MIKITPLQILIIAFVLIGTGVRELHAQRKSELLATIDSLQNQLRMANDSIATARASQRASQAQAQSYENQVNELKDANATLLKNLGSFAEVSNKNTAALTKALSSLEEREAELKNIVDTFSTHDSTIIALLSDAKSTLGPDTKIAVGSGSLVITASLETLFGSDTGVDVVDASKPWLEGVANLLKAYPQFSATIEGLSMTGEISLAANQATAVMNHFQKVLGIDATRLTARGRDGNFSEGVNILLHPDHKSFYSQVRSEIQR